MARAVYYCHTRKELLESVDFSKQDIQALRDLGHDVVGCTSYRGIPLRFDAVYVWW